MNYFWIGFGTTFGTIFGIIISYMTYLVIQWRGKVKRITILRREFTLNLRKIEGLLEQLVKYRSRVTAKDNFHEHLSFYGFLWNTAQNMLYSGLLFGYLEDDKDINNLQTMFVELSAGMSNNINNIVIKKNKDRNEIEALK